MVPSDPKTNDFRYIQGTATEGARSSGGAGGDAAAEPGPGLASPLSVQGLPLFKPPYGQISAIDMNKGEMLWQVAHGETPDAIRNNPALKGVNIPRTGRAGIIGTIVTKTLVIAGEAGTITMPDGKRGAYLRAYDKKTGADAGMIPMPAGQTGSPMTYMLDGKQYIVLAIGAATMDWSRLPTWRAPGCASWFSKHESWWAAAQSPKRYGPGTGFQQRPTWRASCRKRSCETWNSSASVTV
jgi:quinoprotein glucose dehydrogenase